MPSPVHCVTVWGTPAWPSGHWTVSPGLIWSECGCAQEEPALLQNLLLLTNTVCVVPVPASAPSPAMERKASAVMAVSTKAAAMKDAIFAGLIDRIIRAVRTMVRCGFLGR